MKCEFWVVFKATEGYGVYAPGTPYAGQRRVGAIKAVRLTQSKPSVSNEEVCFKMDLDMDEGWFLDEGTPTLQASVPAPPPPETAQVNVDLPVRHRSPSPATKVLRKDP